MDTRFWGPSGWTLLHLIASDTLTPARRAAVKEWFELLEYVLPCKYCRASFHDYMQVQPLTDQVLTSPAIFGKWLYDIHNRVNAKLRAQGLLMTADPSWTSVRSLYAAKHKGLCKGTPFIGWDFLTSIAYTTPSHGVKTTPMSDVPDDTDDLTFAQRNRYNLLTRSERLVVLEAWWRLFPQVLPCDLWRSAWNSALVSAGNPRLAGGREAMMRWIWRLEEAVCQGLSCPTPHASKAAMCSEVAAYESACSVKKRGKTCRAFRKARRRAYQTRRRRKGVAFL
jgi:hypothetical protein